MKTKKIIMIVLLVAFVIGIVVAVININSYSSEKNISNTQIDDNKISETETNTTETNTTNTGSVRNMTKEVEANWNDILEITDNYFIEQTNDIYYNIEDYLGKTIKIEGFISSYEDSNGDKCYCVLRNTPGCCGNDGLAGLDIRCKSEYPKENTWVEVIGVIEKDTAFGQEIPAIQVTSIRQVEEGTTFVTN